MLQLIPLPSETRIQSGFSHKAIISYADLATFGAALTGALAIFPYEPPPLIVENSPQYQTAGYFAQGTAIKKAAVNCTTLFTGPGLTSMKLDVGDPGSVGRYVANATTDLFTPGTANTANPVLGSAGYVYTASDVNNNYTQVQAKFTAVGCNLNALTAGQVEVYLEIARFYELAIVIEPGTP